MKLTLTLTIQEATDFIRDHYPWSVNYPDITIEVPVSESQAESAYDRAVLFANATSAYEFSKHLPNAKKIQTIFIVRRLFQCGLAEAKLAVENNSMAYDYIHKNGSLDGFRVSY